MVSWASLNRCDSYSCLGGGLLTNSLIKALSEQKTPTPIEALAKEGLVSEAITSYKISRLADNQNDGEITFG